MATYRTGDSPLISVKDAAAYLGTSVESVYALVDTGKWIGSCRAGTKPIISRAAFERLYLDGVWHSDEQPVRSPFIHAVKSERQAS